MANEKSNMITESGLAKLQEELDYRIVTLRNEIAKEIDFARSYGDLSENAEYTEAKKKQSENEEEIIRLQLTIRNAVVVSDAEITNERVGLGTTVTVLDVDAEEEIEYSIVGAAEADPFSGKISDECPVGKGLLGATVGETVSIEAPAGAIAFKVLKIELTNKAQ